MPISKKKKKKEFDASLMGGYVPGALPPVNVKPTVFTGTTVNGPFFPEWIDYSDALDFTSMENLNWWTVEAGMAWWSYGTAGLLDPGNFFEATLYQKKFGVSFRIGLLLSSARGFAVAATILTILDPSHKWPGGLDETKYFIGRPETGWRSRTYSGAPDWEQLEEDRQRKSPRAHLYGY